MQRRLKGRETNTEVSFKRCFGNHMDQRKREVRNGKCGEEREEMASCCWDRMEVELKGLEGTRCEGGSGVLSGFEKHIQLCNLCLSIMLS